MFFYLKRLLIALSVVVVKWILVGQLYVFVLTSIFEIMIICLIKPMNTTHLNDIEVFNEVMTLIILYHIFCFTDFVTDPEMRFNLGYSCLFFNFVHLAVNMYFLITETIQTVRIRLMIVFIKFK